MAGNKNDRSPIRGSAVKVVRQRDPVIYYLFSVAHIPFADGTGIGGDISLLCCLLHSREQNPYQLDDDPADQRVDCNGNQREELDLDALETWRVREVLKNP